MQAKFTNFCKRSSIILPLLDPEYVKNIPLRKVPFTSPNSATFHEA